MKTLRTRLGWDAEKEGGLSLIEVIVALMIFGIVAIGVAFSLANILTLSRDSRSRVVAANIASEFIDNARSIENVFSVVDQPDVVRTIAGTKYHVRVETGWITSTDSTAQCGAATASGAGALEYKRVNVEVTWDGMRTGSTPIRSDTLLAPNSRINDPTLGTIVVSAENALGRGSSGITVTTTPSSTPAGAVPVTNQGLPTDSDGCSYVLKVVPGNYDVTLSRTNFVDIGQNVGSTSVNVTVVAGGSALAKVSFDNGAKITNAFDAGVMSPTNMQTTYSATFGDKVLSSSPAQLFPSSYQLIAGTFDATNCKSPDPAAWPTRAGDGAFAARMDPITVAAGSSSIVNLPVGLVTVTNAALNGKFVTAVPQTTGPGGDPGCASPIASNDAPLTKYTFGKATSNTAKLALPYGTYKLYYGTTAGSTTSSLLGNLLSNLGLPIGTAAATVTVDPRVVP